MESFTASQMTIILYAAAMGVSFGIFYDILRFVKVLICKSKYALMFVDFIFALICFVMAFLFFTAFSYGEIRIYLLIIMLIAALIFRFTVGRVTFVFYHLIASLISSVKTVIISAYLIIKVPYKKVTSIIVKLFQKTGKTS